MKADLGLATIGWSPRPDLMARVAPFILTGTSVLKVGLCDGLVEDECQVRAGEDVFVTRAPSGRAVKLGRHMISEQLAVVAKRLMTSVRAAALLCTADVTAPTGMLAAWPLMVEAVLDMDLTGPLGVVVPSSEQVSAAEARWGRSTGLWVTAAAVSPYGPPRVPVMRVAPDAVVMDCMAYGSEHAALIGAALGVPVLWPGPVIGRAITAALKGMPDDE